MYSFRPFLDRLDRNWYEDDEFLQQLLASHAGRSAQGAEVSLVSGGALCAGSCASWPRSPPAPRNRPRLHHLDDYNCRIDEIVLYRPPPGELSRSSRGSTTSVQSMAI